MQQNNDMRLNIKDDFLIEAHFWFLFFFTFAATVNKVFPNTEASKINSILGDFLKKNRARSDAKSPANHE